MDGLALGVVAHVGGWLSAVMRKKSDGGGWVNGAGVELTTHTMNLTRSPVRTVVYEVNVSIDANEREEYEQWLRNEHIRDMLKMDGFVSAEVFRRVEKVPTVIFVLGGPGA